MGRKKRYDVRCMISLPAELAEAINDYRFSNRIGSHSEAVRQLIIKGLCRDQRQARNAAE